MIVISEDLSLEPVSPSQLTANHPVIGYDNRVRFDNIQATSALSDYPITNLANPSTNSLWKASATETVDIDVTISDVEEVDYVALARHNFASKEIAVTIYGATELVEDEPDWFELVQEVQLVDDGPAIFRFEPQSLIAVRVHLAEGTAAAQAAVLYVGKLLVLERRIYVGHTPMPYGRSARITNGRSESGQFLGRIMTAQATDTAVSLQNLMPGWYREHLDPFIVASKLTPFFFAWRPEDYPLEVGYGWMTNDPKPSNQRNNGMMQIDLQMGGIVL